MSTTFTILGCGSSGGVPRLGGQWGDCDPTNPKNKRRRCSLLVERTGPKGTTRVLIDTSPDLRDQLLDADVGTLDAIVYTHPHADHVHGIDDLRMIAFNMSSRLQVWADGETSNALLNRFGYIFAQPKGSSYPPICELNMIALKDLDVWIVDALRRTPHPTHSHLENTLAWIARAAPKRGVLTNMHNDLDYDVVAAETPDNITPAFDMMKITQP